LCCGSFSERLDPFKERAVVQRRCCAPRDGRQIAFDFLKQSGKGAGSLCKLFLQTRKLLGAGWSQSQYLASSIIGINEPLDRKSTRLNSSHDQISYAVFCLKKKISHLTLHMLPYF